jgi:hypothetical protein
VEEDIWGATTATTSTSGNTNTHFHTQWGGAGGDGGGGSSSSGRHHDVLRLLRLLPSNQVKEITLLGDFSDPSMLNSLFTDMAGSSVQQSPSLAPPSSPMYRNSNVVVKKDDSMADRFSVVERLEIFTRVFTDEGFLTSLRRPSKSNSGGSTKPLPPPPPLQLQPTESSLPASASASSASAPASATASASASATYSFLEASTSSPISNLSDRMNNEHNTYVLGASNPQNNNNHTAMIIAAAAASNSTVIRAPPPAAPAPHTLNREGREQEEDSRVAITSLAIRRLLTACPQLTILDIPPIYITLDALHVLHERGFERSQLLGTDNNNNSSIEDGDNSDDLDTFYHCTYVRRV